MTGFTKGRRVRLRHDDSQHYAGVEPTPLPARSTGTVAGVLPCGLVLVRWDRTGATTDHDPYDLEYEG